MPMEQSDTHDDRDLSKNSIRRRKLLSGVGTTMLASPLVGSVAAEGSKSEAVALREQANEIRQNDGQKAWKNYLQSQGCGIHSVKTGMKPSTGVGTQGFDNVDGTPSDCDICLDFTLYSDIYGNYTIDMFWTYDSEQLVGNGGSYPADGIGLYFDPDHWDFEVDSLSGTTYTSSNGVVSVEDDSLVEGLPFAVNDASASDSESYYAGLNIVPIGNYSEQQRYVYGEYLHTWSTEYTTYTASVSYPAGIDMTFNTSETVKSENYDRRRWRYVYETQSVSGRGTVLSLITPVSIRFWSFHSLLIALLSALAV